MTAAVKRWLERQNLTVKTEFVTDWGHCDLVGLEFDEKNVEHRLSMKQSESIGSELRASIFLAIPEEKTGESWSVDDVFRTFDVGIGKAHLERHLSHLIRGRFVSNEDGRLRTRNGWLPLHKRIVAVELKLHRVNDVVRQAASNLAFADESYIALPLDFARERLESLRDRREFVEQGLGLLGIGKRSCRVVIEARPADARLDPLRVYCAEKFWRTRARGS